MLNSAEMDQANDNFRLRAQRQAQLAFSAFLKRLGRPVTKFSLVLTAQPEAIATLSYLRAVKPDLVALVAGANSLLLDWPIDSTSWTVLNDTRCDVPLPEQPPGRSVQDAQPAPSIGGALRKH